MVVAFDAIATEGGCLIVDGRARHDGVWFSADRIQRSVYELRHGPIPEGQYVRRSCGVANCVRLSHLRLKLPAPPPAPPRALVSECLRGHAYDDLNTHVDSRGRRTCRACLRLRQRRRQARLRAAAA